MADNAPRTFEDFLAWGRLTPEEYDRRRRERDHELLDAISHENCQHRIRMAKKLSQIGPRFAERTLAKFQCPPGDPNALDLAFAIVEEPMERGAWYYGEAGNGKSHLAAGIVNAVTDLGVPAAFVSMMALMDSLKASYDRSGKVKTDQHDVIRWLANVEVLVLDDLDKVEFTSYVSQRLCALVNQRYENGGSLNQKPVILTSNRGPADLSIAWAKKGLDPIIGRAILDRLAEMCKSFVCVEGDSYRERLMMGNQR
jgi:DNA replication protein DnaC